MPKMKTHSGAAKRFKRTATGRLKRMKAYHGHNTGKKNRRQLRRLNSPAYVSKADAPAANRMLGG